MSPKESSMMVALLKELTSTDGAFKTAIPGLQLVRKSTIPCTRHVMDAAKLCYVAQGAKAVYYRGHRLVYDPQTFLLLPVSIPLTGEIVDARPSCPMLSVSIALDLDALAVMIREMNLFEAAPPRQEIGIIQPITPELLNALTRYVALLREPAAIPILEPAIRREIYYRLLTSHLGSVLINVVAHRGQLTQIGKALVWFRERAYQSVGMQELAQAACMSKPSMYKAFRELTGMSPLQFQKQLRLQEARRLLSYGHSDITFISDKVGYKSSSQFSREYKRFFGVAPKRDSKQLSRVEPDPVGTIINAAQTESSLARELREPLRAVVS